MNVSLLLISMKNYYMVLILVDRSTVTNVTFEI